MAELTDIAREYSFELYQESKDPDDLLIRARLCWADGMAHAEEGHWKEAQTFAALGQLAQSIARDQLGRG